MKSTDDKPATSTNRERDEAVRLLMPTVPDGALWWRRLLFVASVVLGVFFLEKLTVLLFDYWLLQSLGFESVFWTNFKAGSILFVVGAAGFAAGVAVPTFTHAVPPLVRRAVIHVGVLLGLLGGYLLSLRFGDFLVVAGQEFGKTDPVFGKDVSFYVFMLPSVWWTYWAVFASMTAALIASAVCAAFAADTTGQRGELSLDRLLSSIGSRSTQVQLVLWGAVVAIGVWLGRYDLLLADNYDSSIHVGASYIDVTGLFSNVNYLWLSAATILGLAVLGALALARRFPLATLARLAVMLLAVDFGFKVAVEVRQTIFVAPNEPVIQLEYIAAHVDATRAAFGLDGIEERTLEVNQVGDPLPSARELLETPTLKNAPLWPGFSSFLERYLDVQHADRVIQTSGDRMVYGPTLEAFRQQQKLRTYYDFIGIDAVRYTVDGEKRMYASAVRETPLYEPVPWLAYFGQRYMLFTHGHGLVMAPTGAISEAGDPVYVSRDIPTRADHPALEVDDQSVYYGEGAATMAFSNVEGVMELDYPTEQGRAVIDLPDDIDAGVRMDSLLKRLVFGWRSGQLADMLFSNLITDRTRIHYYRTPLGRMGRLAPFLYFDSNIYAANVDGRITWMVNALSTSDRYPYSKHETLGDKSDERAWFPTKKRLVNYVEDAVKVTVDATTGKVRLYKIADAPVINTWAEIYPELFANEDEMSAELRAQLTYPVHLLHIQFDDLYNFYHMKDPMYYFNQEDMWDDGDEVLGPIMNEGKAITFSIEPYSLILETGGMLPPSAEPQQFAMMMLFTPEKALNLRAVPIVYQDGEDYGKTAVLRVPKGTYVMGPEQADAAIDQSPAISGRFSWWNRRGTEVIRGHTVGLLVKDELLYVEPIFLRSKQNPVTQLKKVAVVFRGIPAMGDTLEEALDKAIAAHTRTLAEHWQPDLPPTDDSLSIDDRERG